MGSAASASSSLARSSIRSAPFFLYSTEFILTRQSEVHFLLRYPCLVLDHDDTTVDSTRAVNYPSSVRLWRGFVPTWRFPRRSSSATASILAFTPCVSRSWAIPRRRWRRMLPCGRSTTKPTTPVLPRDPGDSPPPAGGGGTLLRGVPLRGRCDSRRLRPRRGARPDLVLGAEQRRSAASLLPGRSRRSCAAFPWRRRIS